MHIFIQGWDSDQNVDDDENYQPSTDTQMIAGPLSKSIVDLSMMTNSTRKK
jgi:hypothetical protein